MKKLLNILAVLILLPICLLAKDKDRLELTPIPDSLKQNANAVYRFHNTEWRVNSQNDIVLEVSYAVTILNKKADSYARLIINYDDQSKLMDIEGSRFNSVGVQTKRLKNDEIQDYSAYADYTFFSDNRVKYADLSYNTYPYTVFFKYKKRYKGLISYRRWDLTNFNLAIQKAKLTFSIDNSVHFKKKEINFNGSYSEADIPNGKVHFWELENIKAIRSERLTPNHLSFGPVVMLSPNGFTYEGTHGDLTTWRSYGVWAHMLLNNRSELSEETKQKILNLTDTLPNDYEKAKAIYEYMQAKTRYVNISLGIGGFQPMAANLVDERGYGDCKALSNYTKSLLKIAGIDSYYAEIGNGSRQQILYNDFATADQTNHIILCIPYEQDTIWLECTSQNIPFGFIGEGNSNRKALLITEDGGILANTPHYPAENNTAKSTTKLKIDSVGDITYNTVSDYTNISYYQNAFLLRKSERDLIEYYQKRSDLANYKIQSIDLTEEKDVHPKLRVEIEGSAENYVSTAGKRFFIAAIPFSKQSNIFKSKKERNTDIYLSYGFKEDDSYELEIPKILDCNALPKDVELSCVLGSYSLSFKIDPDNPRIIKVQRNFNIKEGHFDKEHYSEIAKFFKSVARAEKKKIVLTQP